MIISPSVVPVNRMMPSAMPYGSTSAPSVSDFEIERVPKSSLTMLRRVSPTAQATDEDYAFQESVGRFLASKSRSFTVSGTIPVDPSHLILFFRSKTGITHSLDFPIDVTYSTPPALDVLIAACRPHPTSDLGDFPDRESLFYPTNLPLTASLDIASHPILDAVRNTLFPNLPAGHYITSVRDKLEIIVNGGGMAPQPLPNDGRVATILVTLPIRFRGGGLTVRNSEGIIENFHARGGKDGDLEWTAIRSDCQYEMATISKGCRMTLSYGVFTRTFGPSGIYPEPLITPSDHFLDKLSPILNSTRGSKIAFFVENDYGVNPADVLAESLVPELKGGDSVLYHALKIYKLTPELHWTAGGYIWPVDHTVEIGNDIDETDPSGVRMPTIVPRRTASAPPVRGAFSIYTEVGGEEDVEKLKSRIEASGAVLLSDAEITILQDWNSSIPTGKERVPFVAGGELEKLVVNVLMVAYIP